MAEIPAYLRVKFGEEVWHDEPYDGNPADFFDRNAVKEQALSILRSPQTQRAVWLVGERRAGKTSMLKLLLEKCRKERFLVITVPWQSIHSAQAFYRELLAQLDRLMETESSVPVNSAIAFWDALRQRRKQYVLVVAIDELDSILIEQLDDKSKKEITGIIAKLIQEEKTKVIITSVRNADLWIHGFGSPLIEMAENIHLKPFESEDLIEMIKGIAPEFEVDYEAIYNLSGGWPYYAKAILYHLLQLPPDDTQRLERARSEAVKSIASTCEHLYRHHWNENEKRALWLLVNKERIESEEFEQLDASLRAALRELTQRCYLLEENGQYRFRVLLIADWLKGWTRRELEEEKLEIPLLLRKLKDPWAKEPGERIIQVTKEDLRRRGF